MRRVDRMRKVKARLEPAARVHPSLLPVIPEWWPLAEQAPDRDTGEPRPRLTEAERVARRRAYAFEKAREGPFDGTRLMVVFDPAEGPPATYRDVGHPGYVYRLDPASPRSGPLVYRYDPASSSQHAAQMRVVCAAIAEAGPAYTVEARTTGRDPAHA